MRINHFGALNMHTYSISFVVSVLYITCTSTAVTSPCLSKRTQPGDSHPKRPWLGREPPIRTIWDSPYPETPPAHLPGFASRSASEDVSSRSPSHRRFTGLWQLGPFDLDSPSASLRELLKSEPWDFRSTGRGLSRSARALPPREEADEIQEVRPHSGQKSARAPSSPDASGGRSLGASSLSGVALKRPEDRTPTSRQRQEQQPYDPFAKAPASSQRLSNPGPLSQEQATPINIWRQKPGSKLFSAPSSARKTVSGRLRDLKEKMKERFKKKPREPRGIP